MFLSESYPWFPTKGFNKYELKQVQEHPPRLSTSILKLTSIKNVYFEGVIHGQNTILNRALNNHLD